MCKPAYLKSPLALTENTSELCIKPKSQRYEMPVLSGGESSKELQVRSFVFFCSPEYLHPLWVTMKNDFRQFHARSHDWTLPAWAAWLLQEGVHGGVCAPCKVIFFHSVNKIQINLIRLVLKCLDFPLYGQAESTSHICAVGWELWQNLYSLYLVPV